MPASGYHDDFVGGSFRRRVGGWELEYGPLPDGRWAVDFYSDAAPRKQRQYFDHQWQAEEIFGLWPTTPDWAKETTRRSRVIRVDQDVLDELYRRRGVRERNHNAAIRRALAEAESEEQR